VTIAAIAPGSGRDFELVEVELDELRADEVLVNVVAVGVCHTDLSASSGAIPFPLPGVLGHEGAGRVISVGSAVTRVRPGDPVIMSFTSCGRCRNCRAGHLSYCDHHLPWNLLGGRRPDGSTTVRRSGQEINAHFFGQSSFAQTAIADERSLVRIGKDATDDDLALYAPLGCGLQTGAGAVLNVLRPASDTVLAVSGAGAVGLASVMAAASISVQKIIVIDVVQSRLDLAIELGASDVINASTDDVGDALLMLTESRGVDAAIETSGRTSVLETMIGALAISGTCIVVGAPASGSRASFDVNAQIPGRKIMGVTLGDSDPERFIPQLIALHKSGKFPIERLERRYRFEDINIAAEDARSGLTIKPVLLMKKPEK